jgi:hypothetical protein
MLDTSLQPYSTNLFHLLPTGTAAGPSETRNRYYEAGASSKEISPIGTADAPSVERFEEMMARARKETEPSAADDAAPRAKPAEPDNSTDYLRDNGEAAGRKSRAEAEDTDEKELSGENLFAENPVLGMAAARSAQSDHASVEKVPKTEGNDAIREGVAPQGDAAEDGAALSPEDGITITDTYPLFENKPDVRASGFDVPVDSSDDAALPGLMQDAGVMLATGNALDEAGEVKQTRGAKGGRETGLPEETPESEETRAFSFQSLSESDHQLVSLFNKGDNKGSPESAAPKKKADSRKVTVEVVDMRSDSGREAQTAALPVKDIVVDLKDALFGSLGDGASLTSSGASGGGRQMLAGFDQLGQFGQFNHAGMKSAAQLEGFLSRELQGGLNGDIVRQAAVMLRDGGEGLIRLQLHPESLGNVRIKLALSGNRVEGIITVESPEAMNAFEQELASLEMAFRDSGFEGASLNMQMSGGKSGGDLFDGVQAGAFSQLVAASSYESSTVTAGDGARSLYAHGGLSILA